MVLAKHTEHYEILPSAYGRSFRAILVCCWVEVVCLWSKLLWANLGAMLKLKPVGAPAATPLEDKGRPETGASSVGKACQACLNTVGNSAIEIP